MDGESSYDVDLADCHDVDTAASGAYPVASTYRHEARAMMTMLRSVLTAAAVSFVALFSACQQAPPDESSDASPQAADELADDQRTELNEIAIDE